MNQRIEDHIAYAARDYTIWRRPNGETYIEHHRQTPKHRHGVQRDLTAKE